MARPQHVGNRRLRVRDIAHSHRPDRRGERTDKYGRQPIDVERRLFGGYRIVDGNDRLYYARQRGQTHINVRVWRGVA